MVTSLLLNEVYAVRTVYMERPTKVGHPQIERSPFLSSGEHSFAIFIRFITQGWWIGRGMFLNRKGWTIVNIFFGFACWILALGMLWIGPINDVLLFRATHSWDASTLMWLITMEEKVSLTFPSMSGWYAPFMWVGLPFGFTLVGSILIFENEEASSPRVPLDYPRQTLDRY